MDSDSLLGKTRAVVERYGLAVAVLAVALATAVFLPFRSSLASEQWGWPYLLIVGLIAGSAGVWPAIVAAVLAFLSWNFLFIQPYYTLHVARSGDLVHLVAFLVVAVAAGLQTGRLRESKEAASRQEARSSALYRLSSKMVLDVTPAEMAASVDAEVARVLGSRGACVWMLRDTEDLLLQALPSPSECGTSAMSKEAAERALHSSDEGPGASRSAGDSLFLRLSTTTGAEGVLQICGVVWLNDEDRLFASSVAHLVAAYLENRRISELAMRASAAEEAERLRSALVSSVSHELKTPVASLTASVTDLLGRESTPSSSQLRDSLSAMAEDLTRLDRSIGDLLDVSRLEAQAWSPQAVRFEVGELVGSVVSELPKSERGRVRFDIPHGVPLVCADFVQTSRALRHIVDNGLRYSEGPITIGAGRGEKGLVAIWVEDHGPGIPEQERERVFEKFYRGTSGRHSRSSTGLGLALAREIVVANGGEIHIESVMPSGTRLVLAFPTDEEPRT